MENTDLRQAAPERLDGPYYAVSPEALRLARRRRLLTQERLAEVSGVHRGTISQVERGSRRQMLANTLQALARALEVEPEDLLADTQGPGEEDSDER